jgi:hypothetical protein
MVNPGLIARPGFFISFSTRYAFCSFPHLCRCGRWLAAGRLQLWLLYGR